MNVDSLDPALARPAQARAGLLRRMRPARRPWAASATFAAALVTLVRWWAVRDRREFTLWPDEPAQLAIARFVGGGTHWTMRNHSIWRPGYGTLLGPVYAVTDDPLHVFRAAMLLNAVLGGIAAALLVRFARRFTRLGPTGACWAAVAVCVTPALLFPAGFVWSESLVAPLYLAALLALVRFQDAPSRAAGLVVAVVCAAGFLTHSRLLPLSLVAGALVAVAVGRRRLGWGDAALVASALVGGLLAASRYTAFVVDRLWERPSERNSIGGVLDQFGDPSAIAVSAIGQGWYLLAGSLGLVGVALADLARRVRHDRGAGVVVLVIAVQVALSVVFMANRWRADQLVYGRYNDVVVAPLLVLAVACVTGASRVVWSRRALLAAWTASASVMLVAAGVLVVVRADELGTSNGLEPMILAIQPFMDGRPSIPVLRIAAIAAAVGGALVAAVTAVGRTDRRAVGAMTAVVTAPLLLLAVTRTADVIDHGWNGSGGVESVAELAAPGGPLAGGAPVDYYLPPSSDSTARLMLYQWYLPDSEFTVVGDPRVWASSDYLFAHRDTPVLREVGARIVWTDPWQPVALWERPSPDDRPGRAPAS